MAKLRVTIQVEPDGNCVATMDFMNQELEVSASSPSLVLQALAEEVALHEQDDDPVYPEDVSRSEIIREYLQ